MWTVVLHKAKYSEFQTIFKCKSKANAQLFAEDYAISFILNHDGFKEPAVCSSADVDRCLQDMSKNNLDKHFLVAESDPWGFTVVHGVVQTLETKTTSEIDAVDTVMVDTEVSVVRKIEVPNKWYGKSIREITEKQIQPMPTEILVKRQVVSVNQVRSATRSTVFKIHLAYDPSCDASYDASNNDDVQLKNNCRQFANSLNQLNSFKLRDGRSVAQLQVEFPQEFSTWKKCVQYNDCFEIQQHEQLWRWDEVVSFEPAPDQVPNVFEQTYNETFGTGLKRRTPAMPSLPTIPTPPSVHDNARSALASLQNDIIAQHKKMFGKHSQSSPDITKNPPQDLIRITSHREPILKYDVFADATMEALCHEIEHYVKEFEVDSDSESDSLDSLPSLDSDSSDDDSDDDSGDSDWDTEPEPGDIESNGHIFKPREI